MSEYRDLTKEEAARIPEWHLYKQRPDETAGEINKRWKAVGFTWKYKFFVPVAGRFLKWWNKKYYSGVPRADYNVNLEIFDRATDKAIEEWALNGVRPAYNFGQSKKAALDDVKKDRYTYGIFREVKKTVLTFALNNASNREFVNMWMYQLYIEMHEHYKDKPHFQHLVHVSGKAPIVHYAYLFPEYHSGKMVLTCNHHAEQEHPGNARRKKK